MKRKFLLALAVVLMMFVAPSDEANCRSTTAMNNPQEIATAVLDDTEAENLIYMREEEKLARDVYIAMYEKWQIGTFSNISVSEQRHMDAIKILLDRYGIEDPAQEIGLFTNLELQDLYGQLIDQGMPSEIDALMAGALIEEVDISDLRDAIAETDNVDLKTVYSNLESASENHLRTFVGKIESLGYVYTAQHLSQDDVNFILAASPDKGQNQRQSGR